MSLKSTIELVSEQATILTYAIFAVAGMTGGCYVAAYAYVRGRKITGYLILAYLIIGTVTSLMSGLALKVLLNTQLSWEQAWIVGTVVGVTNVLTIAGINFKASVRLPHSESSLEIKLKGNSDD